MNSLRPWLIKLKLYAKLNVSKFALLHCSFMKIASINVCHDSFSVSLSYPVLLLFRNCIIFLICYFLAWTIYIGFTYLSNRKHTHRPNNHCDTRDVFHFCFLDEFSDSDSDWDHGELHQQICLIIQNKPLPKTSAAAEMPSAIIRRCFIMPQGYSNTVYSRNQKSRSHWLLIG